MANSGDADVTALLGGRVRLLQPRRGFRAAIDPVLLAAAVAPRPGDRVLDVGAGSGAAALCLAHRQQDISVIGIDCDAHLVALAASSARCNGVDHRLSFVAADVAAPGTAGRPAVIAAESVDHVMTNPPYMTAGHGRRPANPARAAATVEAGADLDAWLRFCVRTLRSKGTLTMIHRADRLDAVLACLRGRVGDLRLFPLWPGGGRASKRVIIAGRKGSRAPLRLLPGLRLHAADGRYTPAAEAVLRGGEGLAIWDERLTPEAPRST